MDLRGIVLAGGIGTRLRPLTKVTNKHLLPIGQKPMIYYPIEKLTSIGIEQILIVTGIEHMGDVVGLLGSGRNFGCQFTYRVQDEAGGIAVAPHPTAVYRSAPSRQTASYDAIEVLNSADVPFQFLTYLNQKLATRLSLPQTAGSDSHYAPEIGAAYTIVEADPDVDEIIGAIKKGASVPAGNAIPWKIRVERTALKFKRKI